MTAPPDDFYEALGVARDATSAAIKLAYRKLVLKHHPDKVGEGDDKTAAADRFHKIQTAWETIGDEDKRSRYDAQCRLTALRREKELAERDRFAAPDYRPSAYRTSTDIRAQPVPPSPRPQAQRSYSYRAVEVKPPFIDTDFDRYRPSDRKDFDFEHVRPKRTPPKDDRHRSKPSRQESKETERARNREKGRQATKATNRDRDMKHSYTRPEIVTDSDSEPYYERRSARDSREEERARDRDRDRYLEHARQQAEEARSNRYMDERTQKLFSDAQDYQQRMRSTRGHTESRRGSPTRISSARDHSEYTRTADGRPAAVRRSSLKPRTSSRDDFDAMRSSRRGSERDVRRSSVDMDDAPRRPPPLNQTKSAPNEIRIPLEKQRANSVQYHGSIVDDTQLPPPPPVRRADSMPHAVSKERAKPVRSSTLRQTQTTDDYNIRKSPTRSYQYASRSPKDYDDDQDDPVRGQYRTEVREPVGRRLTRSPSPIRGNESPRMSSSRQAPHHLPRTTSTTYAYPMQTGAEVLASRPKLSRTDSGRKDSYLFGEIPTTRSPRDRDPHSPSLADNVRFRETRPDVRVATGYSASRRPSDGRSPSYYKQNSYNSPPVSA